MVPRSLACVLLIACSDDAGTRSDTDGAVVDTTTSPTDDDAGDTETAADAPAEEVDTGDCAATEPSPGCAVPAATTTCRVEVGRGSCRLAVVGAGFIALTDASGVERHVTQSALAIDGEGWLAAPGALYWLGHQGETIAGAGRVGVLEPLPSVTTTRVTLRVNLDPSAPIQSFLSGSAADTSSFMTPVRIYDGLAVPHELDVYFSRSADRRWIWNATTTLGELDGSVSLQVTVAYSGTLEFDEAGALATQTPGFTSASFAGAGPTPIDFDFGVGAGGSTSIAGPSVATITEQDGAGTALVTHVVVDGDGVVTQGSADGRERVIGRLALSRFTKPCVLAAAGEGAWTETFQSGEPELGPPGEDGRGALEVCE